MIYLFEEFPGCTKDALNKINRHDLEKQIEQIKRRKTLEDDENFLKELLKNSFALKKKIPIRLFEQIYDSYKKYYTENEILFKKRAQKIIYHLNKNTLRKIFKKIEEYTNIPFKRKNINLWLVDIYYLKNENNIEGTTTKQGIYIGLPQKPTNLFYSTLIHELIHYNIINRYSEDKEEIIAQIIGLAVSKKILGRIPLQTINTAKRRVCKITKKEFKVVNNIWKCSESIDKFLETTFR